MRITKCATVDGQRVLHVCVLSRRHYSYFVDMQLEVNFSNSSRIMYAI